MCTCKKVFLKIAENSHENICAGVCFLIRKKSTAQVFLLEFCEFFKNNTKCIEHVQSSSKHLQTNIVYCGKNDIRKDGTS